MSVLFLILFLVGGTVAALFLTMKSARSAALAVVGLSIALSAALFYAITGGLSEFSRGIAILVGGAASAVVLLGGCALALGMLDAATTDTNRPIWDVLVGTLVLGSHAFLGRLFLRGDYGLVHLAWDLFGLAALLRGIYGLRKHRETRERRNGDA